MAAVVEAGGVMPKCDVDEVNNTMATLKGSEYVECWGSASSSRMVVEGVEAHEKV